MNEISDMYATLQYQNLLRVGLIGNETPVEIELWWTLEVNICGRVI